MTDWFRSWHGAPTDPKWVLIGRKAGITPALASAIAWALFDHASQAQPRGCVEGFDCEVYAAWGGLEVECVQAAVKAMQDRGMILEGMLANWSKRQPEREDNSTERTRAWRERKKTTSDAPVTQGDAPVTHQIRTETETETNTHSLARATAAETGAEARSDLRQAIVSEYARAKLMAPDTSRAVVWLERGWNPAIIVATIAETLAKSPGKTKPLAYFEGAIADAHAAPAGRSRGPPAAAKPSAFGALRDLAHEIRANKTHPDISGTNPAPTAIGGKRAETGDIVLGDGEWRVAG
jgi:hypothetical protein